MDKITHQIYTYADDIQRTLTDKASRLTIKQYIHLIIVVGAYALLRPYLVKLGGRFQAKDHERELDPDEMSSAAVVSPNSLRGQVQVPEDSDSEEESGAGTGVSKTWGKKARRRQRKMIRELIEAEEKRKMEEEEADSDKEIEEFLVQ